VSARGLPPAEELLRLFSVPMLLSWLDVEAPVLPAAAAAVLRERETRPGLQRSNVGAWHGPPDLCQRDDAALAAVFRSALRAVEFLQVSLCATDTGGVPPAWKYRLQAWGVIMEAGDYAAVHDHAEAHWSFVCYLDEGDADRRDHPRSGIIAWTNPTAPPVQIPGLDPSPRVFELSPRSGQVVVFPGWLPHYVHPYRGRRARISIAGNVRVELAS